MKEGNGTQNGTLADKAKGLFLVLGEVFKILKEEAASDEVKERQEKLEEESRCYHRWDFDYPVIVLAPLGILCIFVLSLVARIRSPRRKGCDAKIDVLVPLDVLTSYRNRTRYVVATTLIVYPCYQLLMAVAFPEITASFLFAITRVGKIITYGTVIYPIFVAINQKSLLASTIGCIMSLVLLATSIIPLYKCTAYIDEYTSEIFARLPMMVCAALMAFIFVYDCVHHFRHGAYLYSCINDSFEDFTRGKVQYVTELFKLKRKTAPIEETNAISRYFQSRRERLMLLWKGHPGFKYPTRVLCTYVSLLVLMYYLIYQAVLFEKETIGNIDNIVHKRVIMRLNRTLSTSQFFSEVVHEGVLDLESADDFLQFLSHALTMVEICFYVSVAISAVVHLLMLASMMLNYRDNVIRAYRGNFHHILPRTKMAPATVVIGFTRYCGYQISFITYSFVFQSFAYAIVLFLGAQLVVFPVVYGYDTPVLDIILRLWPTIVIASILFLTQIVVTRLVFVSSRGQRFEIVRRNAFFIWSYYLFLINALIGLIACLLRIFKAALIAFVSMGRLDWCHLPGKFVTLDPGYLSYVGQIHIDSLHSNPIVLAFVHHIGMAQRNAHCDDKKAHGSGNVGGTKKDGFTTKDEVVELVLSNGENSLDKKAQLRDGRLLRRWFIAYSIMKNPAISHLRKKSSRLTRTVSEHCLPLVTLHQGMCDSDDHHNATTEQC